MSEHEWDCPAPGELWRVQRLINTLDLEDGKDELTAEWLSDNGLGEADDLERVRTLREALRVLLLSHNGEVVDASAVATLDALRGSLVVSFSPDGTPRLAGDDAVGRVLAIVAGAAADGTWERLKTCPADDCHWAFYDFSRNHSRTWCTMSVCGNRAKARTYRSRQPKASA
jgi:predicted RNA-binding Zn ribbon-like protein